MKKRLVSAGLIRVRPASGATASWPTPIPHHWLPRATLPTTGPDHPLWPLMNDNDLLSLFLATKQQSLVDWLIDHADLRFEYGKPLTESTR